MIYIEDLRDGDTIIEHYLCKRKQTMKSKAGKNYLSLILQDKTGTVDAKVWEINNKIRAFEENEFINIEALVTTYHNEIQLNVRQIRRSREGEYFPSDYIPTTLKDTKKLYEEIEELISSIKEKHIKKLLEEIFYLHPYISNEFKVHSAAKSMHHSYLGGLMEHTIGVARICDFLASRYNNVNRDMVVACALLHDVCKIYELSEFPENDYTDEGQLIGHIVMGAELVRETAKKIEGFPPKLIALMCHCILSHHGTLEYGSPKRPKTMEAFILHFADDTDAKLKMVEDIVENSPNTGVWTGYNKMLERNIRKSDIE